MKDSPILFFDGVCNLCNTLIDFVIHHDKRGLIRVASLQGQTAQEKLPPHYTNVLDTVVLYEEGKIYTKTNAVIRALMKINTLFTILAPLLMIPSFIRDPFYNLVARYRYKWFGKRETCRLPTTEERKYFLD